MHEGAIEEMVAYITAHPEIGLLVPRIVDEQGEIQYLCKRTPTVSALLGRRIPGLTTLPFFKKQLDHYSMKDSNYNTTLEPDFCSGCFMLFRSELYKNLGGFDERFFLYFEDTDITLRAKQLARTVYYPNASVTHDWSGGARNNLKLTRIMIQSAIKFFNKWGWRWS